MRSRRKTIVVASIAGILCILALLFYRASTRRVAEPPPVVEMTDPPGAGPAYSPPQEHRTGTVNSAGMDPTAAPASPEELYLARMAETKRALLAKHRYPAMSQPLATKTDLLLPHHVEPVIRMLGGAGDPSAPPGTPKTPGKVKIQQNQDRIYLTPGQNAVASFQALILDGGPAPVTITRSDLTVEAQPDGGAASVIANVNFHDDGVAPDEVGSDGTWTGNVIVPADTAPAGMNLLVDITSGDETGTLAFPFIETASAPGKFTQSARDALEDGSVAFYVGVEIDRPGLYEIVARVYDSTGAPISYVRFLDQLTQASTEVRMAVFGGLLVDEGAVPPLVLRDVEGQRMVLNQYPDREVMVEWPANYTSAKYDIGQFTTKPYVDPEKQAQLGALEKATQDGVTNIRSQGTAAQSPTPPGVPNVPAGGAAPTP
jgi:hypothetical protein